MKEREPSELEDASGTPEAESGAEGRKPYTSPEVVRYGRVEELTGGPSGGIGDGAGGRQQL